MGEVYRATDSTVRCLAEPQSAFLIAQYGPTPNLMPHQLFLYLSIMCVMLYVLVLVSKVFNDLIKLRNRILLVARPDG